ncbi:cytochrome P450 2J2-like [Choloepus didactylus]|uniref:cytochrome P450 2J2-like n=1 Tax=Choloepus didactylus TaxID=27675 RepID=UPI00189D62D8|nr:cytochrome P450 2J2-like [Choloepus didactylus]
MLLEAGRGSGRGTTKWKCAATAGLGWEASRSAGICLDSLAPTADEQAGIPGMLSALGSLAAALWAGFHLLSLLLGAVAFLFIADFLKRNLRRPRNYPPGPPRLPFFGNFFQLGFKQPHVQLQQLVKKYGNLVSLEIGDQPLVIVTGLPLIKEVLVHQEQNFMNRPMTPIREYTFKKDGLIMSSGQTWKEQRRFALSTLRNFGLGKKSLEECIQEEAYHLTEAIKEEKGQAFDPHFKINNAVSNIICSITFGERFEYQDSQFQELLKLLDEVTYIEASMQCQLYNLFPWIMKFLPGSHQTLFRKWEKLKLFVSRMIEEHNRDWNPAEPRDFIDAYLKEIEKNSAGTTSFHEETLICSMLDLFFAGTETTSTTLRWALLYLAVNPEIQEKVQAEIDRVIGHLQQPSTADREHLPYINAVIHEVQRMGNIIPLNVSREVVTDTTVAGYCLPKGTTILTNLTALHRDPAEWATPDTFNPEHFLENGQFKKRESFLPFSAGKRVCLGEQLARSELFLFLTSLMQKFTFRPPNDEKLSLEFRMGLTISPVKHHLCAIPRGR